MVILPNNISKRQFLSAHKTNEVNLQVLYYNLLNENLQLTELLSINGQEVKVYIDREKKSTGKTHDSNTQNLWDSSGVGVTNRSHLYEWSSIVNKGAMLMQHSYKYF